MSELSREYAHHKKVFSKEESQQFLGPCHWTEEGCPWHSAREYILPHSTRTEGTRGLHQRPHIKKGYICPSKSPYASPFFFIKKKDGKLWPVQDYRRVNEWTVRNRYPFPLIPDLINHVKGAALFSKFDICWGYNNIWIKQGDGWKAAFITNKGLFEPWVMFFRLTNLLATFQKMMNVIFSEELIEGWLTIYMDDILVDTEDDVQWHWKLVHWVLDKLTKHNLFLKPEKCLFKKQSMKFLGVILGMGTIQMDPTKLKRCGRLANLKNSMRCLSLPRLHWILSILHPKLLTNRMPINWVDKEDNPIPLGRTTNSSLWTTQNPYVLKAHLTTTGLRTTILLSNRHFSIRHGSHTFTGGRNQPLNQKTHTTSNHLLFKHLHADRTELQHLQTRTFSNH